MIPRPKLSWRVTIGKSTYYGSLRGCLGYWWRALRHTYRIAARREEDD